MKKCENCGQVFEEDMVDSLCDECYVQLEDEGDGLLKPLDFSDSEFNQSAFDFEDEEET